MPFHQLKRRDFITLLGGTGVTWPLAARAQQPGPMRRIGVLVPLSEGDPEQKARLVAFRQGLERLGWTEDRNLHVETRFAAGTRDQYGSLAKELIALQPSVIVAQLPVVVAAVQRETSTIPIVFTNVSDPIGLGLIASLAHPGGNLTGLLLYEASITSKWLAMLKEIAPHLTRVAFVANPKTSPFDYFLRVAASVAPSLAIELAPTRIENSVDIERAIEAFAKEPNGGLLLPADTTTVFHRDLIVALAARHRLPAVYPGRYFVAAGGLMSYDSDRVEMFRQAASYVDRILRGAAAADLPAQAPTKYELVINLKTAKTLGLDVPAQLLARADEVIE